MAALLPLFADGELPFAEPPPRRCYWCRGPTQPLWITDGSDVRRCASATERVCRNTPSDLTAVVLDRVAELPRRWARVRVEAEYIDRDEYADEAWEANHWNDGKWSRYDVPHGIRLTAICHAHPTPSQHLAECLLNDPDIASLLRDVREEHEVRECSGWHRGIGTSECPREPHHHHDDGCTRGLTGVARVFWRDSLRGRVFTPSDDVFEVREDGTLRRPTERMRPATYATILARSENFVGTITVGDGTQRIYMRDFQ